MENAQRWKRTYLDILFVPFNYAFWAQSQLSGKTLRPFFVFAYVCFFFVVVSHIPDNNRSQCFLPQEL